MRALRVGGAGVNHRVLVCLWTTNIEFNILKCRLRIFSRKLKISMTFFERLHDQSLIPRCSFRCSSIICVFFLYLIWLENQNEAFGLRIHPSVIFLECFQKYGIRYGRIRYVDMSLDQKWNGFFFANSFFHQSLVFRYGMTQNECF